MYELKQQKIKSNDCDVEYWLDSDQEYRATFHLPTGQTFKVHIEPEFLRTYRLDTPLVITELREPYKN